MGTKVIISNIIGSHAHVINPRAITPGEVEKYSLTALIAKSDHKAVAAIKAAEAAEIQKKWGGNPPAKIYSPLHDGDGVKPGTGEPYPDECKGCFVLNLSSKKPPVVVDALKQAIADPSQAASGDYFNVSMDAFPYEAPGRKGVSFELLGVQVVRKGTALGMRPVADDFQVLVPSTVTVTDPDTDPDDFLN